MGLRPGGRRPDLPGLHHCPHDEIVSEAEAAEAYVLERTKEQLRATGMTLLAVVVIVVLLAFIGSRTITRPIQDLLAAARRIAEGRP